MSKKSKLDELITDNKENAEKLFAADIKVPSDKNKVEKNISKLIIENKQNSEDLSAAYKIISKQKKEIEKQAADLICADKEKEKRRIELIYAKKELAHKAALIIANKELNQQINERKKAEEALTFQKIKLELALQSSQMGTWELNIVENKHFFDNQACILLGIDSATFGGTAEEFFAAVHPDDHKKIKGATKKTIERNDFYEPEYRTIWQDGSIHHISARGKLFHGDKGTIKMISGIIWDNTESKLKEEELKNSEAKHSSMISNISDVIGIIGTDGIMKYKSSNIEKWFGWHPQELIGTDGFSNVHPDDLDRIKKEFFTLLEIENSSITLEYRYKCKDGSYKQIEITAKNLTNDPVINGLLLNYHDITERKQAEKLLKESEQKSMSIMENSADAIFITNQQGKYVYTNKEVSTMLGYSSEEMKSKTIADILSPTKIEESLKFFEHILSEGKGFTEIELIKKDGNFISTDLNAVILPDGTVYGSCRDITERKQAELELIKAKEKAEESDRLKSAFLANMSHEIRTPMNGILGFSELLKNPNLSIDNQKHFIEIIGKSGERMLRTIGNITEISKIEAGLMTAYISKSNINEQIESLYNFFTPMAESKGLKLSFNLGLSSNEANIKTDDEKIYSILTNLVNNAIMFTDEGSIEFGYEKKGEYLEFFVKDTGIGIPKDSQDAIFEHFVKADIEDKRAFQGSGLGLAISKTYVEMLGGKIWVQSEEDRGSIFYFTIPYYAISEEKSEIESIILAESKEGQLKQLKILIVEDDDLSFLLLSGNLQEFSKEVLHAETGIEAVEYCRNNPDIDLVLMDIRIPKMDGYKATSQIRQFNQDVIIIAQSAYAFISDIEKAIEAGCNDYVSKPINMKLLNELITKHFKR